MVPPKPPVPDQVTIGLVGVAGEVVGGQVVGPDREVAQPGVEAGKFCAHAGTTTPCLGRMGSAIIRE